MNRSLKPIQLLYRKIIAHLTALQSNNQTSPRQEENNPNNLGHSLLTKVASILKYASLLPISVLVFYYVSVYAVDSNIIFFDITNSSEDDDKKLSGLKKLLKSEIDKILSSNVELIKTGSTSLA
ncbi:MAG: hypothetical protein EOP48_07145, partial [Sphingobacteriales bacterium]